MKLAPSVGRRLRILDQHATNVGTTNFFWSLTGHSQVQSGQCFFDGEPGTQDYKRHYQSALGPCSLRCPSQGSTNPARGSRLGGVSFECGKGQENSLSEPTSKLAAACEPTLPRVREAPGAKSPASAAGLLGGHEFYVTPRTSRMPD
jgi:hypothetical protein